MTDRPEMTPPVLLDTDMLSEIIKGKDPFVHERAKQYLAEHGRFAFSAITMYEILRGLLANGALKQVQDFLLLSQNCDVVPVDNAALYRTAELWALAKQQGRSRNDADLMIAAAAIVSGRKLVTGNTSHFDWIPDLTIEDWRKP